MDKFLSILKTTKILGIVGGILLVLGNFFTFWTVKAFGFSSSATLMEVSEGKLIFILGILSLAIIFIDFIISKIPSGKADFLLKLKNQKFILVPTAISAILLFIASGEDTYGMAKLSIGFYLLLIGIICLVAYPFVYKETK